MNKPLIHETKRGEYTVVYGEEIIGHYTSLPEAIEKCDNEFTFVSSAPGYDYDYARQ